MKQFKAAGAAPDYTVVAEAVYAWFTEHGAQFFHTRHGEPFMFFENAIYWIDSADRGRRRRYAAFIYRSHRAGVDVVRLLHRQQGAGQPGPAERKAARPSFLAP